jgi:hypothetical protein
MQQSLHRFKVKKGFQVSQSLHCFKIKDLKVSKSLHRPKRRVTIASLLQKEGFPSATIASLLQKRWALQQHNHNIASSLQKDS